MGMRVDAYTITEGLNGKWLGHRGLACCPAHDDRSPSLSITDGDNGPLVHCFAGCDQMAVITALRYRGLWPEATYEQQQRYIKAKWHRDLQLEKTIINIALFDMKRGRQLSATDKARVHVALERIKGPLYVSRKYT